MEKTYKIIADCRDMYENEIVDTILENRGIKDKEHFLHPLESDLIPHQELNNIDTAYMLYHDACESDKSIAILADTDTDGVTSGVIMARYTREVQNCPCEVYINQGKAHGLKGQDLDRFDDIDLLIIVDSLDADEECYKSLKEDHNVGNIIVLDHHDINPEIPYFKYVTLVSSQDGYANPNLSGAGVVFKFCQYCELVENGDTFYADQYADLAACGILADVMNVSEENYENRYIINLGLNSLNNPALKKIVGGFDFNSKSVLFSIAPLINASNRMFHNEEALALFLANDNKDILKYKKVLEKCKDEQNEIKDSLIADCIAQFDAQGDSKVLYAFIDTPYGVGGLIANTLLEQYNKPIFILGKGENIYAGSMRSVGYGNLSEMINNTGLAEAHGHPEAAGIFINKNDFDVFISKMNELLDGIEQTTSTEVQIDVMVNYSDLTGDLCGKIAEVNKISGQGFKPITFKVVGMEEYDISYWKDGKHILFNSPNALSFIEWNTSADDDEMQDHALMGDEIVGIGSLESGFVGRKYMIKLILDDYWFE